jgi:hypothetical protein
MRILVGTLYSGENEFEECLAAIHSQIGVDFEQLIIENKPELEAHRLLFTSFLERAAEFDLLVKVDADTVLGSPELFGRISDRFEAEPTLEVLSIGLQDFFTGKLIMDCRPIEILRAGIWRRIPSFRISRCWT